MMTSNEIRRVFLKYFSSKGHSIVPSAPIVVKDDPTLMFTNAGMNQFKDIFLGSKAPIAPRLADTQKCLRVSGKHNDLEEVGHDTYHHTMFEMLGNWSFGDYFKKESIEWAWDLLVNVFKIDPSIIYVTIFGGDEEMGLSEDTEAAEEWKKWIPEDRILRFDKKDNFWEMGEIGPCGPASEIHVDIRSLEDKAKVDGATLVNGDNSEVIEIWNLVFIAYNRKSDRSLEPLPEKCVDTGMGFERLVAVMQGKCSNYDSDVFAPYLEFMEKELGCKYNRSEEETIAMRVVMDHLRAVCFSIADGQLPSNTKQGYVIRRILRRGSRYGYQFLGQSDPFLFKMVDVLVDMYKYVFPEVELQKDFIKTTIEQEEISFLRTLVKGTHLFEEYLISNVQANTEIDGDFAFKLKDTFGFPFDLTQLMAREKGWTVDENRYEVLLQEQRSRGQEATKITTGDWVIVEEMEGMPQFTGYDSTTDEVKIMRHRSSKAKKKEVFQLVLNQTPFYAESGGQVGDTGILENGKETVRILNTKKENELIVHFVDRLPKDSLGPWTAKVNPRRRRLTIANHSATHLMHAALRQVLGTHVEQRGSLVNDKVLRFDFSHVQKVSPEEIDQVERIVNEQIAKGVALSEHREIPIAKAKAMGAMALFGEKYGDNVRVIVFDPEFSVELCGGVHVQNTSEIRLFKIVSEGSVAAGVRRIEALTSDKALSFLGEKFEDLSQVSTLLKNPKNPVKAVSDLLDKQRQLEKDLQKLQQQLVGGLKDDLLKQAQPIGKVNFLAAKVDVPNANDLKSLAFDLLKSMDNAVIVLGAAFGEKANLVVALSKALADSGDRHAGQLVKEIAREIRGGGGGQAHFASAGGKDPSGLDRAMAKAKELLSE